MPFSSLFRSQADCANECVEKARKRAAKKKNGLIIFYNAFFRIIVSPFSPELQVQRDHVGDQIGGFRIMCISELKRIEVFVQYAFGWRKADAGAEEAGGKGREGVIAGIVGIGGEVFFEGGEVVRGRLDIIPVKRRN